MNKIYVADFETGINESRDEAWVYMAGLKEVGGNNVAIYYSIQSFVKALNDIVKASKQSIEVYFHNLSFDGSYLLSYLDPAKITSKKFNKGIVAFNYKCNRYTVFFKDTYPLVRCSIKKLGELFGMNKLDSEYRQYLPNSENIIPDIEKDYLRRDVEILERCVIEIQRNNIDGSQAASYGLKEIKRSMAEQSRSSSRVKAYKAGKINELELGTDVFDSRFNKLSWDDNEVIRDAYRSGFNVLNPRFENKIIDENIEDLGDIDIRLQKYLESIGKRRQDIANTVEIQFDINSLYLKVLRDFPMPYGGLVKRLWGDEAVNFLYSKDIKNKIAFVDVYIQVSKGFGVINPVADAFKNLKVDKNGDLYGQLLLPYNEFVILANSFGTIDRLEYTNGFEWLRDFEGQFDLIDIEVTSVDIFYQAQGMFNKFVDKWFNIKHGKKDFLQLISKQVLTNTVGAMGRKGRIGLYSIVNKLENVDENGVGTVTWEINKNVNKQQLDKRAQYTPVPAMVTSIGRCITSWVALQCGDRFIYQDTDSVHVLLQGNFDFLFDSNIYHLANRKGLLSEQDLGMFKIERMVQRALFLKKKTYIEEDVAGEEFAVTAGIPDSKQKFSIDGGDGRVKFELGAKYKQMLPHDIKGGKGIWEETREI